MEILRPYLGVAIHCQWTFWCFDKTGKLKWVDGFENLVVTIGRNKLLDNTFNAVAADVNWFVGLKDTGTIVAADTMASHAGWATISPYSNATDPAWTKNGAASAGAMSNSSSKAVFNINATDEIFGAFLKDSNVVDVATGALFGGDDFGASRNVVNLDTLNVQVDLSLTSS